MNIPIDFSQLSASTLLAALSRALDLTEGEPLGHSIRAAAIGLAVAEQLDLDAAIQGQLYFALLLKDAGCSANAHQVSAWFGADDQQAKQNLKVVNWSKFSQATRYAVQNAKPGAVLWERLVQMAALAKRGPRAARELVVLRCTRGADLVRSLGFSDLAPDAVFYLDEHWDGQGQPMGLKGDAIPLLSRILLLAQTAEIFRSRMGDTAARDVIHQRRGTWFDPALVDAFMHLSASPTFFQEIARMDVPHLPAYDALSGSALKVNNLDGLLAVARVFGQIVDAKSPWTALHSLRCAYYAQSIANVLGWSPEQARRVLLVGFFHDLGKLGVSNLVLDKPGPLDPGERSQIERHAELTYAILSPIPGINAIAQAAGAHHERLDGSGYYRRLRGDAVPLASQIVAVADVFDALTADRPYRPGLSLDQTFAIMERDRHVRLNGDALDALRSLSLPVSLPKTEAEFLALSSV
jgi:HD-GYP domain-containing protein (c-di-GMP phosphodiesterase class II)